MKKIIILTILLSCSSVFSQKYIDTLYNFKVNDGTIIWQKVFELDTLKIKTQLKESEFTSKLNYNSNKIYGRTEKHNKRLVKGFPYWATFGFNCYLTIDIKKNKIRATATDIIFDGPTLNIYGALQKQDYPLQNNVIKKGKIKNTRNNNKALKVLDSVLNSKFILKKQIKDNW